MSRMMSDLRTRRPALRPGWRCGFTLPVFLAAAWLLHWLVATCVTLNASWSAPHWGYARVPITFWPFDIKRGDWIQFTPPGVTPPDVAPPGVTPPVAAPWPYVKQVRGLPGDMVSVSAARAARQPPVRPLDHRAPRHPRPQGRADRRQPARGSTRWSACRSPPR